MPFAQVRAAVTCFDSADVPIARATLHKCEKFCGVADYFLFLLSTLLASSGEIGQKRLDYVLRLANSLFCTTLEDNN